DGLASAPQLVAGGGGDSDDGTAGVTPPAAPIVFCGCTFATTAVTGNFTGPPPLGAQDVLMPWDGVSEFTGTKSLGGGNTLHVRLYAVGSTPTAEVWANSFWSAAAASGFKV